jgi:DNA-binding beta-propeller fold protein YncE
MTLEFVKEILLPEDNGDEGFDHAAVNVKTRKLYVAHTANDALDIIDLSNDRYIYSIDNLKGVAGVLVSQEKELVFTSNRGENTISILHTLKKEKATKVEVGIMPNGLAFDSSRGTLIAANVGMAKSKQGYTLSIVNINSNKPSEEISVNGRTRWALYDSKSDAFYVNIKEPSEIAILDASNVSFVSKTIPIPAVGPHGLDIDNDSGTLFCACDDGTLFSIDAKTGEVLKRNKLNGAPDVIFLNKKLNHLYVAIGDPGLIEVFDSKKLERISSIKTGFGAHTIAFDEMTDSVYVFKPESHSATHYHDH